jgi:hypothetical protein
MSEMLRFVVRIVKDQAENPGSMRQYLAICAFKSISSIDEG